jgi:hypothetical protein
MSGTALFGFFRFRPQTRSHFAQVIWVLSCFLVSKSSTSEPVGNFCHPSPQSQNYLKEFKTKNDAPSIFDRRPVRRYINDTFWGDSLYFPFYDIHKKYVAPFLQKLHWFSYLLQDSNPDHLLPRQMWWPLYHATRAPKWDFLTTYPLNRGKFLTPSPKGWS